MAEKCFLEKEVLSYGRKHNYTGQNQFFHTKKGAGKSADKAEEYRLIAGGKLV